LRIIHVNSYYSQSYFYKSLYAEQIRQKILIDVYVPVAKNYSNKEFDFGEYTRVSKNHNKYDRLIFNLKHSKIENDFKKYYKLTDVDLIHAHSLFSNGYIAYKIHKTKKIPYIVAVRDTDVNVFFKKMYHLRRLGINILKDAKTIIFLSRTYREETIEKFIPKKYQEDIRNKSIILPNGVNSYWLENKYVTKVSNLDHTIKLIYVGRISKRKNIEISLEACQLLKEKGYDIKFTIVGKIEDYKEYKKIRKYEFVKYIPEQPKEILLKLYRENDIFIMPSLTETFGLVYAEAMTQGLPVIYSRGQGFDGQFDEGIVGYSVNSKDSLEVSNKILEISKHYNSLSQNCIKYSDKFNWGEIAMYYKDLYSNIINERGNGLE